MLYHNTSGMIDKHRQSLLRTKQSVVQEAMFIEWFQKYLSAIYSTFYRVGGKVNILPGHEGGFINLNTMEITLYSKLINDLWASGVPPLLVFYHEIGHVLYTELVKEEMVEFQAGLTDAGRKLLNWIEDFYIESKLMRQPEYAFIKPYIRMLHEVVPDFIDDWERPIFALHYYYCYEGLTPLWMSADPNNNIAVRFVNSINQLLQFRSTFKSKFGRGRFQRAFEQFFKLCIDNGILVEDPASPGGVLDPVDTDALNKLLGNNPGQQEAGGHGSRNGTNPQVQGTQPPNQGVAGDAYANTQGDPNNPTNVRRTYKPLDPQKGFDKKLKDLMGLLTNEYQKTLFDTFKLKKKGKPTLVPRTRNTTSPRSQVDPVAIETMRPDIYLEYMIEEFAYTAYNLFIDTSGSVGHNMTYNQLAHDIIQLISTSSYKVFGYANEMVEWTQKDIDDVLNLCGSGGTASNNIAEIVTEKKELGNLNIVMSDGDLSELCARDDIAEITKQYLFVFIVIDPKWGSHYVSTMQQHFSPNQYYVLQDVSDLPRALKHLKAYIDNKGL